MHMPRPIGRIDLLMYNHSGMLLTGISFPCATTEI